MEHRLNQETNKVKNNPHRKMKRILPGQVVISHGWISISFPIQLSLEIFRFLSLDTRHSRLRKRYPSPHVTLHADQSLYFVHTPVSNN
jgi:hypothetical protein